jgi:hypothetical protein
MNWVEFLDQFGLPTTLLGVTALACWRVTTVGGRILFDANSGYVTIAVEAGRDYLNRTATAHEDLVVIAKSMEENIKEVNKGVVELQVQLTDMKVTGLQEELTELRMRSHKRV